MRHPDEPRKVSRAPPGDLEEKPTTVISFVHSDEDGNPGGVLEKWDSEAWIWADVDSLHALEPEPPEGESY